MLELVFLELDVGFVLFNQGASPATPGAHQPAIHRELFEVAVQVGKESVANLWTQSCGTVDFGRQVFTANLAASESFDFFDRGLGRHELFDRFKAVFLDQLIEQIQALVDSNLRLACLQVGRHLAVLLVVSIGTLGQLKVFVYLQAIRRDSQRPCESELGLWVGSDFRMNQRNNTQSLGHLLVVPAHSIWVGFQSGDSISQCDLNQVLLDSHGEVRQINFASLGSIKHALLQRQLEITVGLICAFASMSKSRCDVSNINDRLRNRLARGLCAALF